MKKSLTVKLIAIFILLAIVFLIYNGAVYSTPLIRTYDVLQDNGVKGIKKYTDSIQDGTGDINAKSINVADTLVVDNQVISGSIGILGQNISETIAINNDDGHWYDGVYYQFDYLLTSDNMAVFAYISITIPDTITNIDTIVLNFTYSGWDGIDPTNPNPAFNDSFNSFDFYLENDIYSATKSNLIGSKNTPAIGKYSVELVNIEKFKRE
jgi:hypothetical protein